MNLKTRLPPQSLVDLVIKRTYVADVCVRCGKTVRREAGDEPVGR